MVVSERKTKSERREAVLDAAFDEFGERGFHAASTERIAQAAGISQPYVFRLFGTKKELFIAVATRCFRETLEMFQRAAEGLRGKEALDAMGTAYVDRLLNDRMRLRVQMQAYVACDDPQICAVVRAGYGDLVAYVERVSGLPEKDVAAFFAQGMLLNTFASMDLADEPTEQWAVRLLDACKDIRS
jgi:AcrR family transcriptional regulator